MEEDKTSPENREGNFDLWKRLLKLVGLIFLVAIAYLLLFPVFLIVLEVFFYDLVYDGPEWIEPALDYSSAPAIHVYGSVPLYENYLDWLFTFMD